MVIWGFCSRKGVILELAGGRGMWDVASKVASPPPEALWFRVREFISLSLSVFPLPLGVMRVIQQHPPRREVVSEA